MGINIGKTFLEGNLAKDISSLKIYIIFDPGTPLLSILWKQFKMCPKIFPIMCSPQLKFIMLRN